MTRMVVLGGRREVRCRGLALSRLLLISRSSPNANERSHPHLKKLFELLVPHRSKYTPHADEDARFFSVISPLNLNLHRHASSSSCAAVFPSASFMSDRAPSSSSNFMAFT
jgi:hypothetical protein